jgi:glutaconate CoA-transferase subunit B
MATWTPEEMMTVAAARHLPDRCVCFVGIGKPGVAANLARATHAPGIVLVYESGAIGAKPWRLPLSIGDGELAETADLVVSVPEMFNYWLQGGWIDIGFLGAAQIDRGGRINTTVIGDYTRPSVRLPGSGGAPEIAVSSKRVLVVATHSPRVFVDRLDFVTSGAEGVSAVITDLGVLSRDPASGELVLTALHPGVGVDEVRAATGWPLRVADEVSVSSPPSPGELEALRSLVARGEFAA